MSKKMVANYDVVIVGGGINGAVSAARLAAGGVKVLLLEKDDFASKTSQESSNLVWGGIKYLQSYEFALVYKLCRSRNELLKAYPNRIRQIGFLASIGPTAPFGRLLGLFGTMFYWAIGFFATNRPKVYSPSVANKIEPSFLPGRAALEYFDAELPDNDSRFVWDFIQTAKALGATCLNYKEVKDANFNGSWEISFEDSLSGETGKIFAAALVNATGPFANLISEQFRLQNKSRLALSKGVHLIVPKIHSSERVLAFWDEQGRMFYVLPMSDRSMIGTTDTRVSAETKEVTAEDREFLLRQINKEMNLAKPLTESDIIAERSGVRPLVTDGKSGAEVDWHKLSRKHVVETDAKQKAISLFGGKLTDCLNVAEEVFQEIRRLGLAPASHKTNPWFGEEPVEAKFQFQIKAQIYFASHPDSELMIESLWRRHGSRATLILELIAEDSSKADSVFEGLGICYAEIEHVSQTEDVRTPEDLLRRRLPISMSRSKAEIVSNQRLNSLLSIAPEPIKKTKRLRVNSA